MSWRPRATALWSIVLLFASALCFWKFRILDRGTNPKIEVGPIDLYIEHTPMAQYAYEELARGNLPLWNPYQFCGQPFFAIPHVGLLYPFHLFSLFASAVTSIEISFVLHMSLGGIGMWLLTRRFGLTTLGSLASAVTFMWSGWTVMNHLLPGIFAALAWLPITILLIDRALERTRWAHTALIAAVASQFLIGASEVFVHSMYVAAGFTVCRLVGLVRRGSASDAAIRGAAILGCVVAGLLLSAPQLLPSLEFVAQSGRGGAGQTFGEAVYGGMTPIRFLRSAVGVTGHATVGILPLIGIALVFNDRRLRFVWLFALITALLAALLVSWIPAYRVYYSIPFLGSLFRRPTKFLDIYVFAQALMAGLTLTQLQAMAKLSRAELWKSKSWWICLGIAVAACAFTVSSLDTPPWYWLACLVLLLALGSMTRPRWQLGVFVCLLALQGSSLFFQVGSTHVRPIKRPEIFQTHQKLLESLGETIGPDRVYLSPKFLFRPGLTPKQGMLNRLKITTDYEPLVSARYKTFLQAISPLSERDRTFAFSGAYRLGAETNWTLVDLTASRYFVLRKLESAAKYMHAHPAEFRLLKSERKIEVFERPVALARAYVVAGAIWREDESDVLAVLQGANFDPRLQVVLEQVPATSLPESSEAVDADVKVISDQPEQVVIEVSTPKPGFLVLSDLFYPGWRAFIEDREIEIYRANYLFRAVEVEAGQSQVRFVYDPASFRLGVVIFGVTLTILTAALAWQLRHRGRRLPG